MFEGSDKLVERVLDFNPDYIGFSIRNIDNTMPDNCVYYVDDQVTQTILPVLKITSVPVILGGSGFSIFPSELMEMTKADYGITGEAEETFEHLLDCIDHGDEVVAARNLYIRSSKKHKTNNNFLYPSISSDLFAEIDHRINFDPYKERGAYSIQTKKGCVHGCIYCTYPLLEGKTFRTRNPVHVVDEIEQAAARVGDVMFEFVDSTFNDPKGHAEAICREIIRRKMKVRLRTMGVNPRNSSEEMFELMMEAGFVQIDATPDTASPVMLKNLGKGFHLEEAQQMAAIIRKFNLPTMWFFLFGGPGETDDTVNETLDFIDTYINPDDLVYMAAGLRVYPGTPLEEIAIREKLLQPDQSLLYPPLFYFSEKIPQQRLVQRIREVSAERINCVYSAETRPPAEMLQQAQKLRSEQKLKEPMFRTLLRVRKEWMAKGLI
jgi:radical SAM superfamily enzyme YgiQ (UPF0313 family)